MKLADIPPGSELAYRCAAKQIGTTFIAVGIRTAKPVPASADNSTPVPRLDRSAADGRSRGVRVGIAAADAEAIRYLLVHRFDPCVPEEDLEV